MYSKIFLLKFWSLLPLAFSAPLIARQTDNTTTSGYKSITSYTSENFFSGFQFFTDPDPTNGQVKYQSRASASKLAIAGMLPSVSQQPIYLGLDHKSVAPDGRASVRVSSTQSYDHGLFIFDIAHMPTGCGTWPAAWLLGENWPVNGEIDVLEGVNDQIGNRMTLHTNSGCSIDKSSSTNQFFGNVTTPDCDVNAADQDKNAGCQIANSDTLSFGPGFNAAGGGVYVVEWTSKAISIWFFGRNSANTPSDLTSVLAAPISSAVLNPSSWPTPSARFSGSGCDIDTHFKNQSIVINTSLCGDWAGNTWDQSPGCRAKASTCKEYVANNPTGLKHAFWAINSVQVWQL